MGLQPKYSDLILNLLVALAVSLVVNFSYVLLLLIVDQRERRTAASGQGERHCARRGRNAAGKSRRPRLHRLRERRQRLCDDAAHLPDQPARTATVLVANLAAPRPLTWAHPVMTELRMRNGEEFDYSTLFNRPSKPTELALQLSSIIWSFRSSCFRSSPPSAAGTRRAAVRAPLHTVRAGRRRAVYGRAGHGVAFGTHHAELHGRPYFRLHAAAEVFVRRGGVDALRLGLRAQFEAAGRRHGERAAQEREPHDPLQHARRDRSTPTSSSIRSIRWRCSCARSTTRRR